MIKNKAFRRIFSSFFVITIIYTVVVSGLFFIKDKNATETLLNNSRDAYVTEVKNKMDMQFDLVLRLATQIEQESDFKEYIIGTDENPYIMTKVYQKIVSSVNIFGNIPCMVGVIKNGSDTVITESNTQKLDDYLSEKGLENSLETINTHLLSQSVSGAYYVPLDTKDDIINIAYIKSFSENAYATIILSFYPEDIIPEAIDGGLIIMNKSDLIYESADNILSSESAKKILEDEKVEDLFKKDGMLYRYVTSSTLFDWKYVFALSEKSGIGNLLFVSILIFVVFIFLGLWLAFFESKKIYSPIKKIAGLLNQNNDIVDDEFSYIQEKLTTVLNSNKAESLKGKFLVDVINGFLNHDKIEEGIITYHLENLNSPLNIVIFTFDNYELLAENYSGGSVNDIRNLLFSSIQMQLKTCCSSEIAESDYKSFAMFAQNIDMEKFEKNIADIVMDIDKSFGIDMTAFIGKRVESLFDSDASYVDALNLIECKMSFNKQYVITSKDLESLKNVNYYYPLSVESNLISQIVSGDGDKAMLMLEKLLKRNLYEQPLTQTGILEFRFAIVATAKRILQNLNKTAEEVFGDGSVLYLELNMCKSNQELEVKIKDMFKQILMCTEPVTNGITSVVDKTVEYIESHYGEDISLTDVSEYLELSPGYLSKLFKAEKDINFRDYLNRYRVECAKEILIKNKNVKINELAELVGCNNTATFIRMFKRYEFISPGEFSKKHHS